MPTSPSAAKRLRQTTKRSAANKTLRSAMRTWERKVLAAVESGDGPGARAALPHACQQLDKAARRRIVHPNTAANHKSRLARRVAALGA